MRIERLTSVARLLDPRYATNLAILLLMAGFGLLSALSRLIAGSPQDEILFLSIGTSGAVFFAWALGRELDPDHERSAFVSAFLAMGVILITQEVPPLVPLIWLLLVMRVINRTTGLPSTLLDALALLALGAWLAMTENWAYAALTPLALLMDGILPPRRTQSLVMAGFGLPIAVGALVLNQGPGAVYPTASIFAVGTSALFFPVMAASRRPISKADYTGEPIDGRRVRTAQGLALLAGTLIALWGGTDDLLNLLPLWAAAVGASIYWTLGQLSPKPPN